MNQTRKLLALSALLCLDYSLAFSVAPASAVFSRSCLASPSTSTCLFSEEEGASAEVPKTDDSTYILNSPAFLKRKIDVLQSDIAKADEDIEAAKQRLDEGKAEWGGQLDALQAEVSGFRSRSVCLD